MIDWQYILFGNIEAYKPIIEKGGAVIIAGFLFIALGKRLKKIAVAGIRNFLKWFS